MQEPNTPTILPVSRNATNRIPMSKAKLTKARAKPAPATKVQKQEAAREARFRKLRLIHDRQREIDAAAAERRAK